MLSGGVIQSFSYADVSSVRPELGESFCVQPSMVSRISRGTVDVFAPLFEHKLEPCIWRATESNGE